MSRQESDTIYRQAAIDEVEFGITYAKAFDTETGEVRELFKASNEELQKAVERIKALPSAEPRWIPVTERLPEDTQNIIVTRSDDGTTDFGQYNAKKNWCVNDGYWPNAFDFVAWMPLPEPYKEEEDETD